MFVIKNEEGEYYGGEWTKRLYLYSDQEIAHQESIRVGGTVVEIFIVEKPNRMTSYDYIRGHALAAQLLTLPNLPVTFGRNGKDCFSDFLASITVEGAPKDFALETSSVIHIQMD